MDSATRKSLAVLTVIFLLSACSSIKQISAPVTTELPVLLELGPAMDRQAWIDQQHQLNLAPYLNDLLDDPANRELRPVKVNPALLGREARLISVQVADHQVVRYQLRWSADDNPVKTYWYGDSPSDRNQRFTSPAEVDVDPINWMSLARYGDKVLGDIHVDGQLYRLDYLGAGQQVLIKVDPSKRTLAQTCLQVEDPDPSLPSQLAARRPAVQPRAVSIIRVMMMSTVEARAGYSRRPTDYPSLSDIMEDRLIFANRQLKDSGVDIQYEFAGYIESIVSEKNLTPNAVLNLIRMRGSDAYNQMQAERERLRADLVLTAIIDPSVFGSYYLASRKETGFSTWNVLGDHLDMGHVLGHNIGAQHYWKSGDPDFDPKYQHGYLLPGGNAMTIMADYEDCRTCTRLNYYSNPRKVWQGVPLGTAERHDAVRRLNERRTEVEAFYP
ncbi:hypothetical protein [Pseudomonas sp. CAM1A]|uniref:hypothetical protein n=1 Tax=Pseudomonas sp. CAM1A TaxID=3231717 RepID=UPI0039C68621